MKKLVHHFAEGEEPTLVRTEEVEVPDEEPTVEARLAALEARLARAEQAQVTGDAAKLQAAMKGVG